MNLYMMYIYIYTPNQLGCYPQMHMVHHVLDYLQSNSPGDSWCVTEGMSKTGIVHPNGLNMGNAHSNDEPCNGGELHVNI